MDVLNTFRIQHVPYPQSCLRHHVLQDVLLFLALLSLHPWLATQRPLRTSNSYSKVYVHLSSSTFIYIHPLDTMGTHCIFWWLKSTICKHQKNNLSFLWRCSFFCFRLLSCKQKNEHGWTMMPHSEGLIISTSKELFYKMILSLQCLDNLKLYLEISFYKTIIFACPLRYLKDSSGWSWVLGL